MSFQNLTLKDDTLKDLKASILAIEWEINDTVMDSLLTAIEPLKTEWAGRKPLLVCLQVLGTLGTYVKKAKQRAHPEAVKMLPAVFHVLEKVITEDSLSPNEKVKMIRETVEKYNRLKAEIADKVKAKKSGAGEPAKEETGKQSSTIKNLMEQKEDKAVDGAFNALYQEMVSPGKEEKSTPAAPAPTAMPSMGPAQSADAKEIVLDRVDDEVFPEADSLLDEFFSEEDLDFSMESTEPVTPAVSTAGDTVEVDLGKVEPEEEKKAEEEKAAPQAKTEEEAEEVPTERLEKLVQEINREVTDQTVLELTGEIENLCEAYPEHTSLLMFLEAMAGICRHLKEHDAVARNRSCHLLQEIYDRLSHALFTMQPPDRLLTAHLETMRSFATWQELVAAEIAASRAAAPVPEEGAAVAAGEEVAGGEFTPAMETAVRELVRQEIQLLRDELMEMLESR